MDVKSVSSSLITSQVDTAPKQSSCSPMSRRLICSLMVPVLLMGSSPCFAFAEEVSVVESGRAETQSGLSEVVEGSYSEAVSLEASSSDAGAVLDDGYFDSEYANTCGAAVATVSDDSERPSGGGSSGGFSGSSTAGRPSGSYYGEMERLTGQPRPTVTLLADILGYSVSGNDVLTVSDGGLLVVLIRLGVSVDDGKTSVDSVGSDVNSIYKKLGGVSYNYVLDIRGALKLITSQVDTAPCHESLLPRRSVPDGFSAGRSARARQVPNSIPERLFGAHLAVCGG